MPYGSTERVRAHRLRIRAVKPPKPQKNAKPAMQRAREFRARRRELRSAAPLASLPTAECPTPDNNENQSAPSASKKSSTKPRHFRKRQPYSSYEANDSSHRYFKLKFSDNPFGSVCEICDRLWFKNDLKTFSPREQQLIASKLPDQDLSKLAACKCCVQSLNRGHIPTFAKFNGFQYPEKPAHLPELNSVSERLISPRLPFLKIRRLQNVDDDDRILEQIINVPLRENDMVHHLPRNLFDDYCINVDIAKQSIYKSTDLTELVNKKDIETWLQYMVTTPLYISHNIKINETFFDDKNFAKNPNAGVTESILSDESLMAQQQTLLWNVHKHLEDTPNEGAQARSSLFDDLVSEELSFPGIYLGQFRIFKDGFRITPFTIVSSELKRADRRGVTPHHLLYMAMKVMRMRVNDALTSTKVIGKDLPTSTQPMLSEEYVSQSMETSLSFLKCIPNSSWHWTERKRDLFTMLRQLGKPTLALTLSANETGWPSLLKILHKLQYGTELSTQQVLKLDSLEKNTLVNEDAVTCALHFNKLLNVLMTILQSKKGNPFEVHHVTHYFQHLEFQPNGSPQAHFLLWLDKAPKDPLKDKAAALTLIDKVTSVSANEASKMIHHQIHQHSPKCYRQEGQNGTETCRFDAPYMPSRWTILLTPMPMTNANFTMNAAAYTAMRKNLENYDYETIDDFYQDNDIRSDEHYTDILRAGITRPKVFLKRQPSEKWHESFNPFIMNVLQANMNIQFIPDDHSCADYIMEYINKADVAISDLRRRIITLMNENSQFDMNDVTKELSIDLVNNVEITSQEAAWYLLREPLWQTSSAVIHIPTVRPNERPKIRKNHQQLVGLQVEEDSPEVWKESWYDKYEKRPTELEDLTLAQFVTNYTRNQNNSTYVCRRDPCLIRYRTYDMDKYPVEYKREMVTLHIPFRDEELEILANNKFLQIYEQQREAIFIRRQEFESDLNVHKILADFNRLFREEDIVDDEPEMPYLEPVEIETDPLAGLGEQEVLDISWEMTSDMTDSKMNIIPVTLYPPTLEESNPPEEQLRRIAFTLLNRKHSPFQIFQSGPGASTKTFIIRIMTEIYNRYKNEGGQCNVFTNYTSTNGTETIINNASVYSTLRCPIAKLLALTLDKAEQYRNLFDHIHILIIDEVHTIGADIVAQINKRLRQITGRYDVNFGGITIILVGKLRQSGVSSALPIPNVLNTLKLLELEKVMQQSNGLFAMILRKIGKNEQLDEPELNLLESRFFSEDEVGQFCLQGTRIFASNEAADEYNRSILNSAATKIVSVANDVYIGCTCDEQGTLVQKFLSMPITETRGLPTEIIFVPNKLYMVTANISPKLGLIAGAIGRLSFVERESNGVVVKVWLELANSPNAGGKKRKRGSSTASIPENAVPLERRRWNIPLNERNTVIVTRDHFPLVSAIAISVDNAEGKTFDRVVYVYNEHQSQKLILKALSTVVKITDLYIVTTNNDPTYHHGRKNDKAMAIEQALIDFIISRTTLSVLSFNNKSRQIQSANLINVIRKPPGILLLLETSPDDQAKFDKADFNFEVRFKGLGAKQKAIAILHETNDMVNIATNHMNVRFRQSTSVIAHMTDVAEICGARCTLENKVSIVTVMIYASPNKDVYELIDLIHEILLAYSVQGSGILKKNLAEIPMILGGHFDIDFDSSAAQPLIQFFDNKFNLKINNDPAISYSKSGIMIDGVFSRHLEQLNATSYVLYSSYDKPVVKVSYC